MQETGPRYCWWEGKVVQTLWRQSGGSATDEELSEYGAQRSLSWVLSEKVENVGSQGHTGPRVRGSVLPGGRGVGTPEPFGGGGDEDEVREAHLHHGTPPGRKQRQHCHPQQRGRTPRTSC